MSRSPTISNKPKLSARQSHALVLKLQNHTHAEIGRALRVAKGTVDDWSIQPDFKAAYKTLSADLETRSINALQELRTESERLTMESLQLLKTAITDPALKPHERLAVLAEARSWFQTLHPEPRNGISVSASASAAIIRLTARCLSIKVVNHLRSKWHRLLPTQMSLFGCPITTATRLTFLGHL